MAKKFDISVQEDAEFLKMSFGDFRDWCLGRIIVSIGKGNLPAEVWNVLNWAGDWRVHNLINKQ